VQPAPRRAAVEVGAQRLLRVEQRPEARAVASRQLGRGAVLHDPATVDHQDAVEAGRVAQVVRRAEQRHGCPVLPGDDQQPGALAAVQAAQCLVEDDHPDAVLGQGARQPYALRFTPGQQATVVTERLVAATSSASMEVPSTSVRQASRRPP